MWRFESASFRAGTSASAGSARCGRADKRPERLGREQTGRPRENLLPVRSARSVASRSGESVQTAPLVGAADDEIESDVGREARRNCAIIGTRGK